MATVTTTPAPRYLMQDAEGTLHSYWRLDVLLCDLASNRRDGVRPGGLWQVQAGLTTRYVPTAYEALRSAYAAQLAAQNGA